jgi:hypothetical protein
MRQTGIMLLLAFLLAACGHTGTKAGPYTVQQMATRLGCTYEGGSTEVYVKEGGPCGGWTLYTFGDNTARDNWVKAAKGFGGNFLEGDRWVVSADTAALIGQAKAKLGGS